MTLYLHIGTEKTGSSYLQSMAAMNRQVLQERGIHFPSAGKRDQQMLNGEISAGNAQALTDALEKDNSQYLQRILYGYLQETQALGCNICLLSNELLLLALSRPGRLQMLQLAAEELSVASCNLLLILRNPVEQALSLYKHRAKGGTAPDIEVWPVEHYFYGDGLSHFFRALREVNITFICRLYHSRKGYLEEVFFRDWLGINSLLPTPTNVVNPSLNISELFLIQQMRSSHTQLHEVLYRAFLSIPKSKKAREPRIEQYYQQVLSNYLAQYAETWALCNEHLPESERLTVPSTVKQPDYPLDKVMTFSLEQGETIVQLMQEAMTPAFHWKLRKNRWRKKLSRLKRQLVNA